MRARSKKLFHAHTPISFRSTFFSLPVPNGTTISCRTYVVVLSIESVFAPLHPVVKLLGYWMHCHERFYIVYYMYKFEVFRPFANDPPCPSWLDGCGIPPTHNRPAPPSLPPNSGRHTTQLFSVSHITCMHGIFMKQSTT